MEQEKLPSYKQYPTYSSETICTQFEISEEARVLAGNEKTMCSSIEFCQYQIESIKLLLFQRERGLQQSEVERRCHRGPPPPAVTVRRSSRHPICHTRATTSPSPLSFPSIPPSPPPSSAPPSSLPFPPLHFFSGFEFNPHLPWIPSFPSSAPLSSSSSSSTAENVHAMLPLRPGIHFAQTIKG